MRESKYYNILTNLVIGIMIISLSFAIFANNYPESLAVSKPIYSGDSTKSNVSLMVNVYWGGEYLDEMLDIFESYDIKATFFVGGSWVATNTDKLDEIFIRGHEIGNHGYLHRDHSVMSVDQNVKEISMAETVIEEVTGIDCKLFAPPSGAYNDNVMIACERLGYEVIMWSRDTIDWRDKDPEVVYQRATKNTTNGALILMHPTAHTVEALPRIIDKLKQDGFGIVTVSENIL